MYLRRLVLPAAVATVLAATALPAVAAEDVTVLHVDRRSKQCSDAGSGSAAAPFCTVQAGADAARAGQTVLVHEGGYQEQVTVRQSGEPGRPIVIQATGWDQPTWPDVEISTYGNEQRPRGFVLSGVHDVTVRGFRFWTSSEAVLVENSQRVTVERNQADNSGRLGPTPAIRLAGATTGAVVRRNHVLYNESHGIAVDAGVTGAVVSTNVIVANRGGGVVATDAPDTVITSNTLIGNCAGGVALVGGSPRTAVRNNVITDSDHCTANVQLRVSEGSVPGTTVDHNVVHPLMGGAGYRWGGTNHTTPEQLTAATGQGAHDLGDDPKVSRSSYGSPTPADSVAQDSADASAPGQLDIDLLGNPRADNPLRPNSPTGFHDRGAIELQAIDSLALSVDQTTGPTPLPVTATAKLVRNWPGETSYSFDFGDGSAPVRSNEPTVQHSYPATGTYQVTVTATDPASGRSLSSRPERVTVVAPGDLVAKLSVKPRQYYGGPLAYEFDATGSTSPWPLTGFEYDFGDGTPRWTGGPEAAHSYARPGTYQVTVTGSDSSGRRATSTQQLQVAYSASGYVPITPTRVADTRESGPALYAGEQTQVKLPQLPDGVRPEAVVLNVTAVAGSQPGYLTVRPDGQTSLPGTSNLNYTAGQVVANLVTVPVGVTDQVEIIPSANGTHVVVDAVGYYRAGTGDGFDPVTPARLLDTRTSAPVGPGGTTSIQLRGTHGVPADATAAVLNLTATGPTSAGYLTAYPSGTARPGTSSLNFTPGRTVANQVLVPIGADGRVTVFNSGGSTDVVADLFGYYGPSGGSLFTPVAPARLLDTRPGGALGPDSSTVVPVGGGNGVPADATAAVLNLTATEPGQAGYFTLYPDGGSRPGTSNLNFTAGQTVPNHATVPLGPEGRARLYNVAGRTHAVVDLFGYFGKR